MPYPKEKKLGGIKTYFPLHRGSLRTLHFFHASVSFCHAVLLSICPLGVHLHIHLTRVLNGLDGSSTYLGSIFTAHPHLCRPDLALNFARLVSILC